MVANRATKTVAVRTLWTGLSQRIRFSLETVNVR
jgi:hypothetical protein